MNEIKRVHEGKLAIVTGSARGMFSAFFSGVCCAELTMVHQESVHILLAISLPAGQMSSSTMPRRLRIALLQR